MEYVFDIKNKQVKIKNKRENKNICSQRYSTYTTYLTMRRTRLECINPDIKTMCSNRLEEMKTSVFFDNDLVRYLDTKTDNEIYKLKY